MKENREELDRLLEEMAEETPEMPADFHARWTKQIQEEQKAHKHSERTRQTRYILSAAALFVFLVGGTLITRGWNRRHPAVTAPAPQAQVMYSVDAAGSNALKADALQTAEEREEAAEADNAALMEEAPVMAAQMKEASGMAGNAAEDAGEAAEEEEVFYEAAEALKEENGFISFMRDFARFSLKALGVLAVIAGLAAAVIAGRRYISKNNSKK